MLPNCHPNFTKFPLNQPRLRLPSPPNRCHRSHCPAQLRYYQRNKTNKVRKESSIQRGLVWPRSDIVHCCRFLFVKASDSLDTMTPTVATVAWSSKSSISSISLSSCHTTCYAIWRFNVVPALCKSGDMSATHTVQSFSRYSCHFSCHSASPELRTSRKTKSSSKGSSCMSRPVKIVNMY